MRIKNLELELTNRCNLRCPMCTHNNVKFKKSENLDLSVFEKIDLANIKNVDLCGALSEPSLYPYMFQFIDILNQNTYIKISTNGTTNNTDWWKEIARKLLTHRGSEVVFAIDGLEDTHSIYRIGANFKKLINNIKAFNSAGGKSTSQFIIFKHNQHQVDDVKKLSDDIGCKNMIIRTSSSYNETFERPDLNEEIKTRHELCDTSDNTELQCKHLLRGFIFIDFKGDVFPCCFLSLGKYSKSYMDSYNLYQNHKDDINLYEKTLDEIFQSDYYTYLYKNYKNIDACKSFCKFQHINFIKEV